MSKSQTQGRQSTCNEAIEESGVSGAGLEVDDDHGSKDKRAGLDIDNANEENDNTNWEVESGENLRRRDGEKDVVDELEYIVQC